MYVKKYCNCTWFYTIIERLNSTLHQNTILYLGRTQRAPPEVRVWSLEYLGVCTFLQKAESTKKKKEKTMCFGLY